MRTDRGPCPTARQCRRVGGPRPARQRDRAWAGALVDGHAQSPGAKRKRGERGSRKASGSDGAAAPHSSSSNDAASWWVATTLVSLAHLVLAAAVGLATARLVALAHRGLLRPARGWWLARVGFMPRDAPLRASVRCGREGWRRSPRPSGSATGGSGAAAGGSGRRRRPGSRADRRNRAARRRGSA